MIRHVALAALLLPPGPAAADLSITFRDGNPRDRFTVRNTGCAVVTGQLVIDLAPSAGGVIVDAVRGGPGTKDPMPVEVEAGRLTVAPVADGARRLSMHLGGLAAGERAVVTLDLDDTRGWWPGPRVEVFEQEMAGATATLAAPHGTARATFDATGSARIAGASCADPGPDLPRDDPTPIA